MTTTDGAKANIGVQVRFLPLDPSRTIRGFDPPMEGDQQQGDFGQVKVDFAADSPEESIPWISVSRTATLNPPAGSENLNEHRIKVVFDTPNVASGFRLEVAPGGNILINGGASIELIDDITEFTIKGVDDPQNQNEKAKIYLYPKGVVNPQPAATLGVYVFPEVRLYLGIWCVEDTRHHGTTIAKSRISTSEILKRVNIAYRQACIVFVGVDAASDVDIPYDLNNDGLLDLSSELSPIVEKLSKAAHVNLVLVHQLTGTTKLHEHSTLLGDYLSFMGCSTFDGNDPQNILARKQEHFYLSCAHEIGHQLRLSTRSDDSAGQSGDRHDPGAFPRESVYDVAQGLMLLGTKADIGTWRAWLRHEDWTEAVERARRRLNRGLPWTELMRNESIPSQ